MGGGKWTTDSYNTRSSVKSAAGYKSAFSHDEDIKTGKISAAVHEALDPKKVNNAGDHTDMNIREALDSTEHPNATPIAVLFDQTGSMGSLPRVLQTKLPQLHSLLQRKGYVEDPQILYGAIGDAYSDGAGFIQIGQFESDDRGDEDLENIWLVGNGGGNGGESYELSAYFMARHTYLDRFEKRGEKSYLFIIGDEPIYSTVNAAQVRASIGGISSELTDNIPTADIFKELTEKYHVFFLFARQGSYGESYTLDGQGLYGKSMGWRELLGERALTLDDAAAVCETIALTLGVLEGTVTLEEGMDDLEEAGADTKAISAAGKALAQVGAGASAVATATGTLPVTDEPDDAGTERL